MKVNFVVRRTRKKVDGCVPIEMTICVKGKRQYVATGRDVMPSKFSAGLLSLAFMGFSGVDGGLKNLFGIL